MTASPRCPGCGGAELAPDPARPGQGRFCAACGGALVAAGERLAAFGARVPLAMAPIALEAEVSSGPPGDCPDEGAALVEHWAFGREDLAVFACTACGALFVPPGRWDALRREAARRAPSIPAAASKPAPLLGEPAAPVDRLAFGHPRVDLLALPLAFFFALVFTSTDFGRLLAFPVEIVFHELGHAVPSWLSSRAALPLPCGITFHSEDPSLFTGASFVFLLGVLAHRGHREGRLFAVYVAAAFFALWVVFSVFLSASRTFEIVLLGGIAGELWISTLVVASFYFPMPDRLRWDFFRVIALPPACVGFVATTRLWLGVAGDYARMPLGSLFGGRDDGSGDLDRLMSEHGWRPEALVHAYLGLAFVCAAVMLTLYVVFAARALRTIRDER